MAFKKIKEVIEVGVKGAGAANKELKGLDNAQDKASNSANKLEKQNRHLVKAAKHLSKALNQHTEDSKRNEKQTRKSTTAAQRLKKSIRGVGEALKVAGGAAQAFSGVASVASSLGRTLTKPLGIAVSFEKEFAMVKTLTDQAGVDLESGLVDLAKSVPFSLKDVTSGAYAAISAGVKAPDVVEFMSAASKAAIGTGSDLTSTVSLLASAVNAFGHQGETAATVADKMQMTIKNAVLSGQDLQSIFGMLAPSATLGASLDEVLALTGALTKIGIKPHQAATRVNAMLKELSATTGTSAKAFKRLGIETGISAIQNKGLTAILKEVREKTRGSAVEIKQLSENVRATSGFLGILGEGFSEFIYQVEANADSAGAHVRAAEIVGQTAQGAIERFNSTIDVVLQKMGRDLLPKITGFLDRLSQWLDANSDTLKDAFESTIDLFFKFGNWILSNGSRIAETLGSIVSTTAKAASAAGSVISTAVSFIPGVNTGSAIGDVLRERKAKQAKKRAQEKRDQASAVSSAATERGFKRGTEAEQAEQDLLKGFYVVRNTELIKTGLAHKEQLISSAQILKMDPAEAAEIIQNNLTAIQHEISQLEASGDVAAQRAKIAAARAETVKAAKAMSSAKNKDDKELIADARLRVKHAKEQLKIVQDENQAIKQISFLERSMATVQAQFVKPMSAAADKQRLASAKPIKKRALKPKSSDKARQMAAKINREIEEMKALAASNMARVGPDGQVLAREASAGEQMKNLMARQERILGDFMSKGKNVDIDGLGEAFEMQQDYLAAQLKTKKVDKSDADAEKEAKRQVDELKKRKERGRRRQSIMSRIARDASAPQLMQLADQYARERELFAENNAILLKLDKQYYDKRAALQSKAAADREKAEHSANANVASSIGSTIQSVQALGEAVGASSAVIAGMQSALLLSRGAYHTFMGFSELASAASAMAGTWPFFIPNPVAATAHKFASASHFLAAGTSVIQAGTSFGGGGSSGGASGASATPSQNARLQVNESRSAMTARERQPAVSFGDIILSDVPALLSAAGSKALGTKIAGHVARELGRQSNIQGSVRLSGRAIRGS